MLVAWVYPRLKRTMLTTTPKRNPGSDADVILRIAAQK